MSTLRETASQQLPLRNQELPNTENLHKLNYSQLQSLITLFVYVVKVTLIFL
jgi:hypothetical protein